LQIPDSTTDPCSPPVPQRGKAAIHSFLTAENAENAEKNAEKTSEAIDPPSLILEHATSSCRNPSRDGRPISILSLFPSVFFSASSASSAVTIHSLFTAEDADEYGDGGRYRRHP
jgi:hypothetical protein